MKLYILAIFYIINILPAIAQSAIGQQIDKGKEKALVKTCMEVTTFNYNVNAKKYLTDVGTRTTVSKYSNVATELFQSKLIKTGRKDSQGNEILHIELYQNGILKGKIIPDFEEFPIFATWIDLEYETDPNTKQLANSKIGKILPKTVILLPDANQPFALFNGGTTNYDIAIANSDKSTNNKAVKAGLAILYVDGSNPNFIGSNKDLRETTAQRWLKDHKTLWETGWEYAENLLKKNKDKHYNELIKEFVLQEEMYLQYENKFSACKISYVYDNKENVNEIVFHFPYDDVKYYDKPQFYVKAIKTDDSKGLFIVKNDNKNLPLLSVRQYIVPFKDRLLLTSIENNGVFINQIIVPNLFDTFYYNAKNTKDYRKRTFFTMINSSIAGVNIKDEYEKWVKFKNFDQAYVYSNDIMIVDVFMQKYLQGLKGLKLPTFSK